MTMHQCPKCELRFTWSTELDDHCRNEHPSFHHDYPIRPVVEEAAEEPPAPADPAGTKRTSAILSTWWTER
jgi:hypothetical protein